uniref:Uncharacterized protein n=1 Tax=Kalanchoe fedtschenkoi TaxID=63787 RepID=A0A7N0TTF2_KALFE
MRNEEKGVLVSPVESSAEWGDDDNREEKEAFRTQPERHSHSLSEARMWVGAAVDCGGQDTGEKTVILSRDSKMGVAEFVVKRSRIAVGGLLGKDKECAPVRAVGVVDDCIGDGLNVSTKLAVGKEIQECSEAAVMDENVMIDKVVVLSSDCVEVARVVEECHECSVEGETFRISHDAEIGASKCSAVVGAGKVNELLCPDNIAVERVKRVGSSASNISISHNVNSNKRILPSSFGTCSNKGVSGAQIGHEVGRVRSDVEGHGSMVETHKRPGDEGAAETEKGGAGKKAFEPSNEVLADNILKVLDYLVKKQEQKSVYEEKPDIIGSAVKAGIKFPRPSWKPEVSEDDSC